MTTRDLGRLSTICEKKYAAVTSDNELKGREITDPARVVEHGELANAPSKCYCFGSGIPEYFRPQQGVPGKKGARVDGRHAITR